MGQVHDSNMTTRVIFDEKGDNGLIVGGKYLPKELLAEMFCYVDYESLLNCQLVCKRWKILIQSYVWRKKAESCVGRSLLLGKDVPWDVYYLICKKKPFERNLIKNHSGEHGSQKYWTVHQNGGDHWKVENPPVGAPMLPIDATVLEGKQFCFVTSYSDCTKAQIINLELEGLTPYILDNVQPPIWVSEWYSARWDCSAVYACDVKLLDNTVISQARIIDSFKFRKHIQWEDQNIWNYIWHEFVGYGPGLRAISFCHSGVDSQYWAGHYGSKMAGACVCVKIPTVQYCDNEESNILLDAD